MKLWPFKKRHRITLMFKSGSQMMFTCESFTVKWVGNELISIEWVRLNPGHLFIDLTAVEAIWEHK